MYCRVEDVLSVVSRDFNESDSTAAYLSTGQIEDAITSAGREIDAKLSHQYRTPFADYEDDPATPPLVQEIARDIAAYLADLTYRQDVDYTSEQEPMLLRYRRAQELLQLLINGTISLAGVELTDPGYEKARADSVTINPYEGQLFGLEDLDLGYGRRHGRWEYYPGSDWS